MNNFHGLKTQYNKCHLSPNWFIGLIQFLPKSQQGFYRYVCVWSLEQLCLTLWPMNCRLPGFSSCGVFQARILEWFAIFYSRGSSQPKDCLHWQADSLPLALIPWRRAWQPLQYSCLENPMVGGGWQPAVHRVTKSQTWLKWLSTHSTVSPGKPRYRQTYRQTYSKIYRQVYSQKN